MGAGCIGDLGPFDFSGGNIVPISSGISSLAAAIVLCQLKGFPHDHLSLHNLSYTVIGAGLLWIGWFSLNAGGALAVDAIATSAFMATNIAATAETSAGMFTEWAIGGKPTFLGAASSVLAGSVDYSGRRLCNPP